MPGQKILLAEDAPLNSMIITDMLTQLGYSVVCAENGLEAYKHATETEFDLIFMDIRMPVMDGYESARKIFETLKEKTPPILALSACDGSNEVAEAYAVGMKAFVSKPVTVAALKGALSEFLPACLPPATATAYALKNDFLDGLLLRAPEKAEKLARLTLNSAEGLISEIKKNLSEHDREALRDSAHTLKSTFAQAGAEDYAALARNMEQGAETLPWPELEKIVPDLENGLTALRLGLKKYLRAM